MWPMYVIFNKFLKVEEENNGKPAQSRFNLVEYFPLKLVLSKENWDSENLSQSISFEDIEPLMRTLSTLVHVNNPNLILFVGEALVGNDAVDQLSKFNQKLGDLSPSPNPRLIDGILLTKFDTIDDKVGVALSMVYISGAPVMFIGCGQSYTDLKKLNAKAIVKTLLK